MAVDLSWMAMVSPLVFLWLSLLKADTSTNNLLAYRPRYNSGLVAVLINLNGLFPCIQGRPVERPLCFRVTYEEDEFNQGKAIIEAADGAYHFRVWADGKTLTHAFAI